MCKLVLIILASADVICFDLKLEINIVEKHFLIRLLSSFGKATYSSPVIG